MQKKYEPSEAEAAALADARKKHPRAELYNAAGHSVIVRPADEGEFDRYMAEMLEKSTKPSATRTLFRSCCVYPERAGVDALLADRPGLGLTFGGKVAELSGIVSDDDVGKA